MSELIYAHCALRARSRPAITARWPRMPRGGVPRALDLGRGLWVIVSTVPAREYQRGLAERLNDVEWVAECGAAHHDVIARAAQRRAVAPFRLLILFRSEDRVIAEVTRLRSRIERALDRVSDRREWVVRVAALSRAAGARRVARELVAELKDYADQIVQRPSRAAHVLYDGALLVSRTREHDLGKAIRQWAARLVPVGGRVSLTGPWPPYSFVSLDDARSGASNDPT